MDEIHVIGGNCLKGSITVQGSKNTVLPIMAASLLQREICVLRGCPRILDVCYMEEILHILGVVTWWKGHDLYLDCSKVCGMEIASEYTGRMRCSVILLGALLGRNQRGVIGYPGGRDRKTSDRSSSVCAEKSGCDNFRKKRKNSGRLQKTERAGDKFS